VVISPINWEGKRTKSGASSYSASGGSNVVHGEHEKGGGGDDSLTKERITGRPRRGALLEDEEGSCLKMIVLCPFKILRRKKQANRTSSGSGKGVYTGAGKRGNSSCKNFSSK